MNTLESHCLLLMCGLFAYVGLLLYCYLNSCYEKWNRKRQAQRCYRNDLFRRKCAYSYNYFKNYFYELAETNPRLLATDLAAICVSKMTRKIL